MNKDNSRFLKLPIKSINNVVKSELQQLHEDFSFESNGCIFKNCYYDFRVTRLFVDFELLDIDIPQTNNYEIHINQIDTAQPIILCVVSKYKLSCYLLDEEFFVGIANKLFKQHNNMYYQLHLPFNIIKENCKQII